MAHDATKDAHAEAGHVVPLWLLSGVFGALVVLTWVTVEVTRFDFGQLNIWIAIAIAAVKATLVALYFMHLRWDRPFNGVILLISLVLLVLFLGLALRDGIAYMPEQIPGYAPEIRR